VGDDAARRPRFRLYLITDRALVESRDLVAVCDEVLSAAAREFGRGTVALQLREKDMTARELYALALRLREVCSRNGAPFVVNDRVDVAVAAAADGVHLPASSFAVADARALLGPARIVGVSTHTLGEVAAAARAGADFAVFGPVYDPISKSGYGPARGIHELRAAVETVSMPVYALGGITAQRAREAMRATDGRAAGVAVIGAVFGAKSPAAVMRDLLSALGVTPAQSS
jgi:thiamine-phosphate pyrophosphorylase